MAWRASWVVGCRLTEIVYRWLSGVKIVDMDSLTKAIAVLHEEHRLPHIIITSIRFPSSGPMGAVPTLNIVGSTRLSDCKPRIFKIEFPALDCFFSGTGDMFAALMLARLREAVSKIQGLTERDSWISEDDVKAVDLPLARAAEIALASMQDLLAITKQKRDRLLERLDEDMDTKKKHILTTRAAEVQLVRNLECLRSPAVSYKAEAVEFTGI